MVDGSPHGGLGLELTDISEVTMNRLPEPTGDVGFDSPEALIELLEDLLRIAEELEVAVNRCFDAPDEVAPSLLIVQAADLLQASVDLLHRLANHSEHPLAQGRDFSDARFAVSMAIDELERQRRVVGGLDQDAVGRQRLFAAVAEAKGVTTKALINVERALCDDIEREPLLGQYLSLEDSLETRRVYGKMRRALLKFERRSDIPPHEEVVARLRRAGTAFVHLRGHDCYPTLRVEDRFQFDRLWDRVYGWLQAESKAEQTYAGWLIWEDVINFVELLGSINFRQELREHDTVLAGEVLAGLDEADDRGTVGEELAEQLNGLTGYNTTIDELIAEGSEAGVSDWRRQLHRIQRG